MTLLLTRADVAALLTMEDCIASVEEAFRRYGQGMSEQPKTLGLHSAEGTFHIKAAVADVMVTKINANFPGNPTRHRLPTVQGLIVVMDVERGTTMAVLDSSLITTLRTAAATAVAAKYLARADTSTVTVIGCGTQGRATVEALRLVRPVRTVYAFDADFAAAEALARDMSRPPGSEVLPVRSFEEAVPRSDIVVTCTPSREPILHARHLHPGLFIAGVGADNPRKQELAPSLLRESRVVADLIDQAAAMGDLHHALGAGMMTLQDVHGELPEVVCGGVSGRTGDDEVFVFDSTGTALQDVSVASLACSRALERGAGRELMFS